MGREQRLRHVVGGPRSHRRALRADTPTPPSPRHSWNLGNIHFISYSSEVFFVRSQDVARQQEWLLADLKQANARRDQQPWVVAFGHRCAGRDAGGELAAFVGALTSATAINPRGRSHPLLTQPNVLQQHGR